MNVRRRYESPARRARAARTRHAILTAAHELFVTHGYAGTSMRAVAATAGVSVATVELGFGTKARLLAAVVDVARAGDEVAVPLLERPAATTAAAAPDLEDFLTGVATEVATVAARAGAVLAVVAAAAGAHDEIAALARDIDTQRRAVAAWIVDGVGQRRALRASLTHRRAVDVTWTLLDPALHRRLTADCGWTGTEFSRWLTDALARLLAE